MELIIISGCFIGIICSVLTVLLNANLFCRIVLNKSQRREEMQLFYYRFALDFFYGLASCSYIGFTFLILIFPYTVQDLHFLIVYLALPCSNIAACRSIIAFFIVIERVMALYFPRIYRISIERVPNWLVFTVGACFGASENLALFVICSYDMEIPEACRFFGCAINKCFFKFWSMHRGIIFSVMVVFSIMISVKLYVLNHSGLHKSNNQLSKANRLALLDTFTVLLFDILPAICAVLWPTSYMFDVNHVGPYNAYLKIIGCVIESFIVTTILLFGQNSSSVRSTTIAVPSRHS
ncbi:Serpentine Receptor, class BC (Class B-like) [Caenorhabditis elegans]|uniref:Serpentine Receptor, class BC (Class B-like) n=1 Tax=Caenorhabditis elegans TaxID=6239 RepID=Q965T8_CAEEL|nr:Serpentine Receptor, class BC (Class B-like) [Caenorhabditis elegans]CCD72456.1 Serpentine Receptor, class BC (Class B-like) [Caenorhabditis elegans]|eukprot:NP_503302.1 Serpentine Receptor, class BC (class B-like) [Caenorhabditis elegans]